MLGQPDCLLEWKIHQDGWVEIVDIVYLDFSTVSCSILRGKPRKSDLDVWAEVNRDLAEQQIPEGCNEVI